MKWIGIIAVLGVAAIVMVIAFDKSITAYTHRYRQTIVVEDNGVKRSGSSVIEVSWHQQLQNLPIPLPQFVANVRGDATVIDLSNGRALVALLGPAGSSGQVLGPEFRVWAASGLPDGNVSVPRIQHQVGVRPLEGKNIPDFIILNDLTDPRSARMTKFDGGTREFVPGVELLAATVEITSDPVTRDIEKKLPWWSGEGRPAVIAWRALLASTTAGSSVEPESLFRRGTGQP